MKNNNSIRIQNELPELLEAICSHPDCPEWLYDGIWDLINDKGGAIKLAAYFCSDAIILKHVAKAMYIKVNKRFSKKFRCQMLQVSVIKSYRENGKIRHRTLLYLTSMPKNFLTRRSGRKIF